MSWQDYFPYKPRFGQDKIAEFVTKTIYNKEIGIVEAPYGIGKTIVMLASGLASATSSISTDSNNSIAQPTEAEIKKTNLINSPGRKKLVFATCDHAIQETIFREVLNLNKKLNKKLLVASILGKKHMCLYLEKFDYDICDYERFHDRCPFYNKTYSKKKIKKLSILASSLLTEIKSLIREADFFEREKFVQFVIEQCKEKGICPYEFMLELASESDVIILDYFHVFTPILPLMQKRIFEPNQTVLFIDESDRLQPRLLDILTISISSFGLYRLSRQIEKAMKKNKKFGGEKQERQEDIQITREDYDFYLFFYNSFKEFLRERYGQAKEKQIEEKSMGKEIGEENENKEELYIDVARQEFINFLEKALSMNFHEIMFKLRTIIEKLLAHGYKKVVSRPDKFLSLWLTREDYFNYALFTEKGQSLRLSPYELVNVPLVENAIRQFYFQDILKQFNSAILFSATIGKPEIFMQCLGIDKAEFFSSKEFNTENYSVLLKKDISSIYKKRNYNIEKAIKDIFFIEKKLGGLLLAFPSYDCSRLLSNLQLKHVSELDIETDRQINKQNETKNEKNIYWVVLGGKGSRGINKAAKLPAVYIFGLQLPKPSDYLFQKRKSYMFKKYEREKALQLLYNNVVNQSCQVAGRIFRDTNKKGVVILADKRYKYDFMLRDFFYNCIPSYFKTKLKEVEQKEFELEVEKFSV